MYSNQKLQINKSTSMKNLTSDVVFQTAKNLISQNGFTTTLDVKNELRTQGYWATQHQVSKMLFADYASEGLDFVQTGDHRQYVESTATPVATVASPTTSPYIAGTTPLVGQSKDDAIALCEANGLVYDGSNLKQVQNGTLRFTDPKNPNEAFTITAKGYARRHMVGYMGEAMYQLNKRTKTTRTTKWGTATEYKRILLPGQYVTLAETVVRIAKRHRS